MKEKDVQVLLGRPYHLFGICLRRRSPDSDCEVERLSALMMRNIVWSQHLEEPDLSCQ